MSKPTVKVSGPWPIRWRGRWQTPRQPVLERARKGLLKLTHQDGDRIVRLVVRRCRLNLVEVCPGQVVVHHWGRHGQADLRPWFKLHGLARPEIEVVLRDRKKELVTQKSGDNFLYGDRLATDFPLDMYLAKWANRFVRQPDDGQAAPGTWSGFAWQGVVDGLIPWAALKSAWQRSSSVICQNCDQPILLTNFARPWTDRFNRTPKFVHVCAGCRRSFMDDGVRDVPVWIVANLAAEARPDFMMGWNRRVKWTPVA